MHAHRIGAHVRTLHAADKQGPTSCTACVPKLMCCRSWYTLYLLAFLLMRAVSVTHAPPSQIGNAMLHALLSLAQTQPMNTSLSKSCINTAVPFRAIKCSSWSVGAAASEFHPQRKCILPNAPGGPASEQNARLLMHHPTAPGMVPSHAAHCAWLFLPELRTHADPLLRLLHLLPWHATKEYTLKNLGSAPLADC